MKKLILLTLLLNGCAVYNTPGAYTPQYDYSHYGRHHHHFDRHFDPYNSYYHRW